MSRTKKLAIWALLPVLFIALPLASQAALINVVFGVTADPLPANGGPLAGTSASGTFSFSDSLIPAGGTGNLLNFGGLGINSLSFVWDGVTWNTSNADAYALSFVGGNLVEFGIGGLPSGLNAISASVGPDIVIAPPSFSYSRQFGTAIWGGEDAEFRQISAGPAPVPEPSTILLLGSGLVGLVGFGRKKVKQ